MTRTNPDSKAQGDLKAAFDEMLASLAAARDAIDDPALKPPPPTDRNLAEGYRYLMGYVCGAVERAFAEDTDFPYFKRAVPLHNKSTWDNSDNLYLSAPIDGAQSYRIRGQAHDTRHWRGEPAADPCAPLYVIFTAVTHYTGDSGGIAELVPEVTNNTGSVDTGDLVVESDGSFEILVAPERPAGHSGNFLCTRTTSPAGNEQLARYVIGRELFGDWAKERSLELEIVNLARLGAPMPPITPEAAAEKLRRAGSLVNHQMRFWNDFFATILDGYGDSPAKTDYAFPEPNQAIQPSPPSATVGAGQATNIYAGGIFDLGDDEALIVEQRIPVEPVYTGFNLCNIWGESYDFANAMTSLNNVQVAADADGCVRYVIAHRDPGVNNWLDTTGHTRGMLSQRWAYHQLPDDLPTVETRLVAFADVLDQLPADTKRVTPEERREQIRVRQAHTQLRYRQS
ncbi:MAG: DUF1214 domain-containing protein [Myxococcales bacterium]|nr:DUF1214 domain-containing protein [Myxococcales bacterium]